MSGEGPPSNTPAQDNAPRPGVPPARSEGAAARLAIQRQRLAEQRSRLLVGQASVGQGGADASKAPGAALAHPRGRPQGGPAGITPQMATPRATFPKPSAGPQTEQTATFPGSMVSASASPLGSVATVEGVTSAKPPTSSALLGPPTVVQPSNFHAPRAPPQTGIIAPPGTTATESKAGPLAERAAGMEPQPLSSGKGGVSRRVNNSDGALHTAPTASQKGSSADKGTPLPAFPAPPPLPFKSAALPPAATPFASSAAPSGDDDASFFSDYTEGVESAAAASTLPTGEVGAPVLISEQGAPQQVQVSQAEDVGPAPGDQGWGNGSGYVYAETSYPAEPSYVSWETQSGYGDVVAPAYEAGPPVNHAVQDAWHIDSTATSTPPAIFQPETGAAALDYSYQGGQEAAAQPSYSIAWSSTQYDYNGQYGGSGGQAAYPAQAAWGHEASQYDYAAVNYGQGGTGAEQAGWGYEAAALPTTVRDAGRLPYGRPPIALVSFGCGGRVCVMQPQRGHQFSGQQSSLEHDASALDAPSYSGPLLLLRFASLARSLRMRNAAPEATLADGWDKTYELLQQFPGPLVNSTNRAKVVGYVRERELKVIEEEDGCLSPDALACLWGILRVLSLNDGNLRPSPPAKGKIAGEPVEGQVAAVLAMPGGASVASAPHTQPWQGSTMPQQPAAVADEVQRLLMTGNREDALRTAMDGGLWGPALLLARHQGSDAFSQAAAAMVGSLCVAGTPLSIILNVMAGASDAIFPAQGSGGGAVYGGLTSGSGSVADWRSSLSVLAANRTPGDEAVFIRMGDRLWCEQGQAAAAHVCYVIGGMRPEPFSQEARLCLVGWDHRFSPRSFSSLTSLQRTQILEWASPAQPSGQGQGPGGGQWVTCLPYKLIYAMRLSEYGLVEPALQYCKLVLDALSSMQRPPPALLVCRAVALDFQDRLQQHAQIFNIRVNQVAGGTLMSSVGRWLDRGINKLIGGDLVGPPSSTGSEGEQLQPAAPDSQGRPPLAPAQHSRGSSAGLPSPGKLAHLEPVQASRSSTTGSEHSAGERSTGRTSSISLSGVLGRVGGLLGSIPAPVKKDTQIGEENAFYYDEVSKQWRERGAAPPPAAVAPPPPPMAFPDAGSLAPPPGMGGPSRAKRMGTHARYVDTFASQGSEPMSGAVPGIPTFRPSPALPHPPMLFVPSGSAPGSGPPSSGARYGEVHASRPFVHTGEAEPEKSWATPVSASPALGQPLGPASHADNGMTDLEL